MSRKHWVAIGAFLIIIAWIGVVTMSVVPSAPRVNPKAPAPDPIIVESGSVQHRCSFLFALDDLPLKCRLSYFENAHSASLQFDNALPVPEEASWYAESNQQLRRMTAQAYGMFMPSPETFHDQGYDILWERFYQGRNHEAVAEFI